MLKQHFKKCGGAQQRAQEGSSLIAGRTKNLQHAPSTLCVFLKSFTINTCILRIPFNLVVRCFCLLLYYSSSGSLLHVVGCTKRIGDPPAKKNQPVVSTYHVNKHVINKNNLTCKEQLINKSNVYTYTHNTMGHASTCTAPVSRRRRFCVAM